MKRELVDINKQFVFSISVTIGAESKSLKMSVVSAHYNMGDWEKHFRYDEVIVNGSELCKTGNYVHMIASRDPIKSRSVEVHHHDYQISGRWDAMVPLSRDVTEYHCHDSAGAFVITIDTRQIAI